MPRKTRKSCNPCKERHIRCDRGSPCSNCSKSKYLIDCSYEPAKFKFRTSVIVSPKRDTRGNRTQSAERPEDSGARASPDRISGPDTQIDTVDTINCASIVNLDEPRTQTPKTPPPNPRLNVQPQAIPDKTEAFIFNFYLQTAGPWLDIVSPNRFFGVHVPQMAVKEPALFSACLAYASQVLYLHGHIQNQIKDALHDRALTQLTPMLASFHDGHPLGSILATTVLLRMTEQFLELGEDHQHHLYGSSTLFQICLDGWSLFDDSPSSTSFWAYLRGSIRVSFMLEKPCPFASGRLDILQDLFRTSKMMDEVYTNVITYLLAEICTLFWGEPDSTVDRTAKRKSLESAIYEWRDRLPASFQPWYIDFGESDTFPDMRCLAPWHCVGWQFFYAAQIMFAVYSPTIERSNVFNITRFIEDKITTPTRWLCGITSSSNDHGVKINGSHLVAWSAQFLTGRAEQGLVLNMLTSLWEETGWPNQTSYERLRGLWSGTRRCWTGDEVDA